MDAVDTNVLVYAHRSDSPFHDVAESAVRALAEGTAPWAIPWPCVTEFYSVVTHPRIYSPPSTPQQAVAQLRAWLDSPSVVLLSEPRESWPILEALLLDGAIAGPKAHDARIASICLAHGVGELLTTDRDFARFPSLRTRDIRAPRRDKTAE